MTETESIQSNARQERDDVPSVTENERCALSAFFDAYCDDHLFCFLPFTRVETRSGLPRRLVRRTVRSLARKGLVEFSKGLCTEDGDFVGSGYGITRRGVAVAERLDAMVNPHLSSQAEK